MCRSSSIKKVLPAIVPNFKDGCAKLNSKIKKEQDVIRKVLWEYCKLDILAMVKVLEKLKIYSALSFII